MARVMAIYRTPKDAAAFDKYYFESHVPLAKTLPGLKKYEVSQGTIATPAGESGIHRIAVLHFEDLRAVQAALASAEGQATAADVGMFAPEPGDVQILIFDTRQV